MKKFKKPILILIFPLIVFILYLTADFYHQFTKSHIIVCIFNSFSGYFCPGCGITRSIYSLIRGDILNSVRCNPIVPICVLYLICLYIEKLFAEFGKKVKIIPRSNLLLCIIVGGLLIFYILRNFIDVLAPL